MPVDLPDLQGLAATGVPESAVGLAALAVELYGQATAPPWQAGRFAGSSDHRRVRRGFEPATGYH
jgi:hypothetical protein